MSVGDLDGWPLDQIVCNEQWYEYWQIINEARSREKLLTKYVEEHHVLPQGLGGKRYGEVVCLTYVEHFRVHELLTKFCCGAALVSMNYALNKMTRGRKNKVNITAEQYAIARKALRDACEDPVERVRLSTIARELMQDPTHRKRLSNEAQKQWEDRDPDIRKALYARRDSWKDDPVKAQKRKEKQERSQRKLWSDPAHRSKMLAALALGRQSKSRPRMSVEDKKSIRILEILRLGPMSFKEICEQSGYTVGPVRMRLVLLKKAGQVETRRGHGAKWNLPGQIIAPYETKRVLRRRVSEERRQQIIADLLSSPFCTSERRASILANDRNSSLPPSSRP